MSKNVETGYDLCNLYGIMKSHCKCEISKGLGSNMMTHGNDVIHNAVRRFPFLEEC